MINDLTSLKVQAHVTYVTSKGNGDSIRHWFTDPLSEPMDVLKKIGERHELDRWAVIAKLDGISQRLNSVSARDEKIGRLSFRTFFFEWKVLDNQADTRAGNF